jgi:hypothetical protein
MSLNPIARWRRETGLFRRAFRWIGAVVLVAAGLLLSVPGIPGPGFVLLIAGVLVLLPESRWLQRKYVKLRRRYPRVFGPVERRFLRRRRRPRRRRIDCAA